MPVACFDNGATREVVGDCGAYATPGDVEALATAMHAACRIARTACRARAEACFAENVMLDAYEQAYRTAIAATRPGAGRATPPPRVPAILP